MKKAIPLFVVLTYLLMGCKKPSVESQVTFADDPGTQAGVAVKVHTTIAGVGILYQPVQARGKIRSGFEELVRAQMGGLVESCVAGNGMRVKKGDLLATLETGSLELRRERLLAHKFHSEKEYESQFLGYAALLREKTGKEAEEVQQKLRIASGLTALEIDLREIERELGLARIKAPVNGILAEVGIAAGMTLRPGQELFRIYDPAHLFLQARIPETDLPLLHVGQRALVTPVSNPERRYPAILEAIDPQVDADAMVTVNLRMQQVGGLFPGMNALSRIEVPQKKGVLVPREALVSRNDRPVVFTVENGYAKWNYVRPGVENGEWVEILEGVAAGAEVIISNNIFLAHHVAVQPVRSTPTPQ